MNNSIFTNSYRFKTRLAPTPSGFLHLGNGASFVATWALARANAGKILLRIDDLDAQRMRVEYLEDIFKTLEWLGVDWDEGAFSVGDFLKNWSQHHRVEQYDNALKDLQKTGDLYACTCSRKDIKLVSTNGLYPQTCRQNHLSSTAVYQKNTAWRIFIEDNQRVNFNHFEKTSPLSIKPILGEKQTILQPFDVHLSQNMGDFIVRQKNGLPSYQLASLVDDVFFKIDVIVRGEDLLDSTSAQIYLAQKLNQSDFIKAKFWHHPLITDAKGTKLSKSEGATALADMRQRKASAAVVVRQAAQWLGCENFEGETGLELVDFIKNA